MAVETHVKIVGVEIPFSDMIILIVKWVIASIPAMIILGFIAAAIAAAIGGIGSLL